MLVELIIRPKKQVRCLMTETVNVKVISTYIKINVKYIDLNKYIPHHLSPTSLHSRRDLNLRVLRTVFTLL